MCGPRGGFSTSDSAGRTVTLSGAQPGDLSASRHEATARTSVTTVTWPARSPFYPAGDRRGSSRASWSSAPRGSTCSDRAPSGASADPRALRRHGGGPSQPGPHIPAWREFLDKHPDGSRYAGSGSRSGPAAHRRSSSSVSGTRRCSTWPSPTRPWRLLCPYDVDALRQAVDGGAQPPVHPAASRRSGAGGIRRGNASGTPQPAPLPKPRRCLESINFRAGPARIVRAVTEARAGLRPDRGSSRPRSRCARSPPTAWCTAAGRAPTGCGVTAGRWSPRSVTAGASRTRWPGAAPGPSRTGPRTLDRQPALRPVQIRTSPGGSVVRLHRARRRLAHSLDEGRRSWPWLLSG